ncbi:hypothetical protein J2S09_001530 [Bacillus fengqiuensis]|nr:hypothetical protein [Bacillus fengqiuensis]
MIVEHLSHRDEQIAKVILFFIFLYLAYVIAEYIVGRRKTAVVTTVFSLSVFACIEQIIKWIYP